MPGVAFHLAWCIIMISIVKDLWVTVEVEKHKAKKLAKERGVNVPVDSATFRTSQDSWGFSVGDRNSCCGSVMAAKQFPPSNTPPCVTDPAQWSYSCLYGNWRSGFRFSSPGNRRPVADCPLAAHPESAFLEIVCHSEGVMLSSAARK
jgi:hypothetical protein